MDQVVEIPEDTAPVKKKITNAEAIMQDRDKLLETLRRACLVPSSFSNNWCKNHCTQSDNCKGANQDDICCAICTQVLNAWLDEEAVDEPNLEQKGEK